MTDRGYKQILLELMSLKDEGTLESRLGPAIAALNTTELASVFVDVAFLVSAIKFVGEERWLQKQASAKDVPFAKFIKKLFTGELAPVLFMHEFFENSTADEIARASQNAVTIEAAVIEAAKLKSPGEQKLFAITALRLMSELFDFEHRMTIQKQESGLQLGLSLYRTFDRLDEVFNLDYFADRGMFASPTEKERLYEGAGVGVQSSYSTTLTALRYLNPARNSGFIDLGSGYGRVGLVVGLMRPDIDFVGYEYVDHRVVIANSASATLGLNKHVNFSTQDLSLSDFEIPAVDTYYIYDSFSESTYNHVLPQLLKIARQKKITIVTKGNARQWLEKATASGNWAPVQQIDDGNLCFFRSR